jgi:hypothetical protein
MLDRINSRENAEEMKKPMRAGNNPFGAIPEV